MNTSIRKTLSGLRYMRGLMRVLFIEGDTSSIRVLSGVASLGWCVGLWLPLHTFDRPYYAWMRALAGEWTWGGLFLLHFMGVFWRITEPVERVTWALAVNILGFVIWFAATSAQLLAVGGYTPGSSMEVVITLALFVALVRTGRNAEPWSA